MTFLSACQLKCYDVLTLTQIIFKLEKDSFFLDKLKLNLSFGLLIYWKIFHLDQNSGLKKDSNVCIAQFFWNSRFTIKYSD